MPLLLLICHYILKFLSILFTLPIKIFICKFYIKTTIGWGYFFEINSYPTYFDINIIWKKNIHPMQKISYWWLISKLKTIALAYINIICRNQIIFHLIDNQCEVNLLNILLQWYILYTYVQVLIRFLCLRHEPLIIYNISLVNSVNYNLPHYFIKSIGFNVEMVSNSIISWHFCGFG